MLGTLSRMAVGLAAVGAMAGAQAQVQVMDFQDLPATAGNPVVGTSFPNSGHYALWKFEATSQNCYNAPWPCDGSWSAYQGSLDIASGNTALFNNVNNITVATDNFSGNTGAGASMKIFTQGGQDVYLVGLEVANFPLQSPGQDVYQVELYRDSALVGYWFGALNSNASFQGSSASLSMSSYLDANGVLTSTGSGILIDTIVVFGANNVINLDNVAYSVTPVPEPSTYAMMIAGLLGVGALARRRAKKA